jgi:ribonuclease D
MSEGRYRALLCLVQVAVEDPRAGRDSETILIDGCRTSTSRRWPSCSPIRRSRSCSTPAARTSRSCAAPGSTEINNIFDTQIAAGLRRRERAGRLRQPARLDPRLRVGKTASYTRWDARPLTAEQLSYAAEDVVHLLSWRRDPARLRSSRDGSKWAREECRRLESATDERDPETAGSGCRASGSSTAARRSRGARGLARAHGLRARTARSARSWQDPALVELAKRHPDDLGALEQIRGIHPSTIKRRGQAILEAMRWPGRPADPARGPGAGARTPATRR